jgi:KaiC/GvpD/RAD55 family RecA-like ATPase
LIPDGVEYGKLILIEFDPDSVWYETSLSMTADALRLQIRTDYHTFQRPPGEISQSLTKLGIDASALEKLNTLRVIDDYSGQTGIGSGVAQRRGAHSGGRALKLSLEWSVSAIQLIKGDPEPMEVRRLHVDDNTSVLSDYNKENEIVNYWRTRLLPVTRKLELVMVNAIVSRVHSDSFYRQMESLADGIIDFRSEDRSGELNHLVRVRTMRGRSHDSRWRSLRLSDSGKVSIIR